MTIFGIALSDIAMAFVSIAVLIYLVVEYGQKICEKLGWFQEHRTKKQKAKDEKKKQEMKKVVEETLEVSLPKFLEKYELRDETQAKILDNQQMILNRLVNSTNDLLRQAMTIIYYTYLPKKEILEYDKEVYLHMYEDYTAQGGNSFIEGITKELKTWTVVRK